MYEGSWTVTEGLLSFLGVKVLSFTLSNCSQAFLLQYLARWKERYWWVRLIFTRFWKA